MSAVKHPRVFSRQMEAIWLNYVTCLKKMMAYNVQYERMLVCLKTQRIVQCIFLPNFLSRFHYTRNTSSTKKLFFFSKQGMNLEEEVF